MPKWQFWTRAWNLKKILAKTILLKHYKNGKKKTCPRVCQIQDLCRKKYKKGIFSEVQRWKKFSTHFSDSTHQECMIFSRIGHGPCYHHWNEIFAGVSSHLDFFRYLGKGTSINDVPRFLPFFDLPIYVPICPIWKKLPILWRPILPTTVLFNQFLKSSMVSSNPEWKFSPLSMQIISTCTVFLKIGNI